MKLLRRLFDYWLTPAALPPRHHQDQLDDHQQRLVAEARERVRRTPL